MTEEADHARLAPGLDEGAAIQEQARLVTGTSFWATGPSPLLGGRGIAFTDGPGGARGADFRQQSPSTLLPCPTALAATWDIDLIRGLGALAGVETREKGCDVLLAPAINLQRSPFGGRHFEYWSEDPVLTGLAGAAFVDGVQSVGIAATAKHYVGNEIETDRRTYDARIDEATLREVYLRPFEEAVRAGVRVVMAAYNRVGGTAMTEHAALLDGVLRREWSFDGVVVSDWFAAGDARASAAGGLDITMPGGALSVWHEALEKLVLTGEVDPLVLRAKVDRIVALRRWLDRPRETITLSGPERADLVRTAAARSVTLLRNDGTLPLAAPATVALIGANAASLTLQGGGSAQVRHERHPGLAAALRAALPPGTAVVEHGGLRHAATAPALAGSRARDPRTGGPGVRIVLRDAGGAILSDEAAEQAAVALLGHAGAFSAVQIAQGEVAADVTGAGPHRLTVAGSGAFAVLVDDVVRAEFTLPTCDDTIEGLVRPPVREIVLELDGPAQRLCVRNDRSDQRTSYAFEIGFEPVGPTAKEQITDAAAVAAGADVAIVVVGTDARTESEGFDRTSLALPGDQDALVRAVAAANPRTIAVVNSGGPVLTPWAGDVAALAFSWFGGERAAEGLADVLVGTVEPGGRLPFTWPGGEPEVAHLHPSHRPAGEDVVDYAEGTRLRCRLPVPSGAVAFGTGLGYTTWQWIGGAVRPVDAETIEVTVDLVNTGARAGREVVQVYAEGTDGVRLVGFGTVDAAAGGAVSARVEVPLRFLRRWDVDAEGWVIPPGEHVLHAGPAVDRPLVTLRWGIGLGD